MLPPCGLILTRPGDTAIRAGAMFRPWGLTLTPTGDTEMSVCTNTSSGEASTLCTTIHSSVLSILTDTIMMLRLMHAAKQKLSVKHAHAQAQQA